MPTELSYLLKELNNWTDDEVITIRKLKELIVNSFIKAEKDKEQIISSEDYIH